MNYALLEDMNERQLKNFHSYISDCLRRCRSKNIGWLRAMEPVWASGKTKAEQLLAKMENATV